jgi:hypothetical protein
MPTTTPTPTDALAAGARRAADIDALATRAEALPPDSRLRTALEELAFLLDDGPDGDLEQHWAVWRAEIDELREAVRAAEDACGSWVHRHGTDLVCALRAGHGGDEHNTAADGSGDAFPVTC